MKKIKSKKVRQVSTQISGFKVGIALANKVDWMHIQKISESSARRLNRLIQSGKYNVSSMVSDISGSVIFIRTK